MKLQQPLYQLGNFKNHLLKINLTKLFSFKKQRVIFTYYQQHTHKLILVLKDNSIQLECDVIKN